MMDDGLRQEVLNTYGAYVKAFRENDVPALDRFIQYPLPYVGDGRTALVGTYPVQPADLMAAKQWHHTKDLDPELVFLTQGPRDCATCDAAAGRWVTDRGCLRLLCPDQDGGRLEVFRLFRHHRSDQSGLRPYWVLHATP
jgi:hypothetical protein